MLRRLLPLTVMMTLVGCQDPDEWTRVSPPEGYCAEPAPLSGFVTRDGDLLVDDDGEVRFISFNVPNLHVIEDPAWHLPDPWEQEDALCSVRRAGGTVARIYVLSVGESGVDLPRHVVAPGVFTEELFVALDQALAIANRYGVRLIIPLVDQWEWWGGIATYAAFHGLPPEAFFTDAAVIASFKQTVEHLLTRTNTVTGVPYREDPAILAWETGNELMATDEWTADIAATIKSLDPRHLVMDGREGVFESALSDPNIDIVSNHAWQWSPGMWAGYVARDRDLARGRRPYVVGELGQASTSAIRSLFDRVIEDGVTGALLWSLRFHDVSGGFYWHNEREPYRAYHWPGFPSGDAYDEREVLALLRDRAHAIRGEPRALVPPGPPELFPIDDPAAISFRGSAGAASYELQRAPAVDGPWEVVASGFDDAQAPNQARVADPDPPSGGPVLYRLIAHNEAGSSVPSAPLAPDL